MTCFCRQTSFTVRNFLKRSEIFWSDVYGVNSLASDSRPTRKTDTVVQDGHVCLLRFGCNAVCETLLYQFTSSTFGVWIFNFFFSSSLLPPPAYFHFPWQSRLVCVQYVSKSLSVPLAECRPPAHTHTHRDRRFTLLASSIISPRTYLRDESCQSSKKSLSLALFYCADSGRRRTLRQERNRLSLRFLCVFSFLFFFYLFDDPFRTTRRHTKEINKNT